MAHGVRECVGASTGGMRREVGPQAPAGGQPSLANPSLRISASRTASPKGSALRRSIAGPTAAWSILIPSSPANCASRVAAAFATILYLCCASRSNCFRSSCPAAPITACATSRRYKERLSEYFKLSLSLLGTLDRRSRVLSQKPRF